MSAYLCAPDHIAYLATYYVNVVCRDWRDDTMRDPADLAELLARENVASIDARYRGESDQFYAGGVDVYVSDCRAAAMLRAWTDYRGAELAKAVHCYEYQSCEHEAWEQSKAHIIMRKIIDSIVRRLPGYDGAPWGAPEPNAAVFRLKA